MPDRAALHAAVCAAPDDDTPRLVFADWLDEHGETDRAARIRAAVEYTRRKNAGDTAAAAFEQLCTSNARIPSADWVALDPNLGRLTELHAVVSAGAGKPTQKGDGVPRMPGITFESSPNGFLTSARASDGGAFLKHADDLFRHAPVTRVTFSNLEPDDARAIVRAGFLGRIRELALGWVSPEAVQVLGNHPDAAGVQAVEVEGPDEGDGVVEALTASRHWTGVRRLVFEDLDMSDEPVTDEMIAGLLRRKPFRGLRELTLFGAEVGEETATAIASAGFHDLWFLNIGVNEIGDDGAEALAVARRLPALRMLDLSANGIRSGAAAARIITSPRLPNLTVLNLGYNAIHGLDPKVLAGPCRPPVLRVLNLASNQPAAAGLEALVGCPAVRGLWSLELNYCGVSTGPIRALVAAEGFDQLTVLELGGNALTPNGAAALANWPKAASLRALTVSENPIKAAGGRAILESPHLTNLRNLGLSRSRVKSVAAALKKRFGKALMWV